MRSVSLSVDRIAVVCAFDEYQQPPAQVALGPDFKTTAGPRGADFAMMLATFYCRALNPPSALSPFHQ